MKKLKKVIIGSLLAIMLLMPTSNTANAVCENCATGVFPCCFLIHVRMDMNGNKEVIGAAVLGWWGTL